MEKVSYPSKKTQLFSPENQGEKERLRRRRKVYESRVTLVHVRVSELTSWIDNSFFLQSVWEGSLHWVCMGDDWFNGNGKSPLLKYWQEYLRKGIQNKKSIYTCKIGGTEVVNLKMAPAIECLYKFQIKQWCQWREWIQVIKTLTAVINTENFQESR